MHRLQSVIQDVTQQTKKTNYVVWTRKLSLPGVWVITVLSFQHSWSTIAGLQASADEMYHVKTIERSTSTYSQRFHIKVNRKLDLCIKLDSWHFIRITQETKLLLSFCNNLWHIFQGCTLTFINRARAKKHLHIYCMLNGWTFTHSPLAYCAWFYAAWAFSSLSLK